jgi:hypothetical protein
VRDPVEGRGVVGPSARRDRRVTRRRVARRFSEHAALPVGRPPCGRSPGGIGRLIESPEVARHALGLGDHGEQAHAALAAASRRATRRRTAAPGRRRRRHRRSLRCLPDGARHPDRGSGDQRLPLPQPRQVASSTISMLVCAARRTSIRIGTAAPRRSARITHRDPRSRRVQAPAAQRSSSPRTTKRSLRPCFRCSSSSRKGEGYVSKGTPTIAATAASQRCAPVPSRSGSSSTGSTRALALRSFRRHLDDTYRDTILYVQ